MTVQHHGSSLASNCYPKSLSPLFILPLHFCVCQHRKGIAQIKPGYCLTILSTIHFSLTFAVRIYCTLMFPNRDWGNWVCLTFRKDDWMDMLALFKYLKRHQIRSLSQTSNYGIRALTNRWVDIDWMLGKIFCKEEEFDNQTVTCEYDRIYCIFLWDILI